MALWEGKATLSCQTTRGSADKAVSGLNKERTQSASHIAPEPLLVNPHVHPSPFGLAQRPSFQPDPSATETPSRLLRLVSLGGVFEQNDNSQASGNPELEQLIRAASKDISTSGSLTHISPTSPLADKPCSSANSSPSHFQWDALPTDIWLQIASKLSPAARSHSRLCCSTFRYAANLSTRALDFGDSRSNFFYQTPRNFSSSGFTSVVHVRCANPTELPLHDFDARPVLTLDLKSLVHSAINPSPFLHFQNLRTLKAARAPHGIPYDHLPRTLTALTVGCIGPTSRSATLLPALPTASVAEEFSSLLHLDVPITFPVAETCLAALLAFPSLESLGGQGRIKVDGWPCGLADLVQLTGLTRLSFTAQFNCQLSQLSCLRDLKCMELFCKEGPKAADWTDLLEAIPAVTSLSLHNAPTPDTQLYALPLLATALPKLQHLVLTSAGTQFDFVVQLPSLGPASGLTALTHLTLRQATMQDPALRAWLAQLDVQTAPPALKECELEGRAGGYNLQAVSSCLGLQHLSLVFPEQSLEPAAATAIKELGSNCLASLRVRTPFSPPDLLEDVLQGVPNLKRLDVAAPRMSRVPLQELARQLSELEHLQSLTVMLPVAGHSSLTGTNSLSHLCLLTCLETLQVRCSPSTEQSSALQQKLSELAAHPSIRSLQIQLPRKPAIPEQEQLRLDFISALRTFALATGARASIVYSK